MKLQDSITVLPGIGPKKAELFANLGVYTLRDLITLFPRTYEDRTALRTIASLEPGEPACFEAMVVSDPRTAHIRRGLDITHVTVADETGRLKITFFNQQFAAKNLSYGESYIFYGVMDGGFTGTGMRNPIFEPLSASGTATNCILPVYPLTAGLTNKIVRKAVQAALDGCLSEMQEVLPEAVLKKHRFCDCRTAYRIIHNPSSFDELDTARQRLVFEEFFIFSCGLSLMRARRTAIFRKPMRNVNAEPFFSALPFKPTGAQKRAVSEICADFRKSVPMNRLLQGDVGSGKTMVAAAAAYFSYLNGFQTLVMAPTEVLARQHYATFEKMLGTLGVRVELLSGSLTAKQKKEVREAAASGEIDVLVGTQALIQKTSVLKKTGLVVVDEQHRFGVAQRSALAEKGAAPHILAMSATPIPRTLALIMYGDLDVSVLNEMPKGRIPIKTYAVDTSFRPRIYNFIKKHIAEGRQAYIVCPLVEESENSRSEKASAIEYYERLCAGEFRDIPAGLLYGRMKQADKDEVMRKFRDNELKLLVSTTVIEVGIDVPNANVMLIENAEQFGLSQLHQLRGRVGRGSEQSYCVLMTDNGSEYTKARTDAMVKTTDGFEIAKQDLALRGPGNFFGRQQHGLPPLKVADIADDAEVLYEVDALSQKLLSEDALLLSPENAELRGNVEQLFGQNDIYGWN